MLKDDILHAHEARFACKRFDTQKSIPEEELSFLLEIARLSPSSIGSEPWKFMVIRDPLLRERLKPVCWNQNQITDASELIVILSKNEHHLIDLGYLDALIARKNMSDFVRQFVLERPSIDEWTQKQCYIALANLMSTASMLGIDSCPIEGFTSSDAVADVLDIDKTRYDVAVLLALGYRDMPVTPKARLPFEDVVEFV